MLWLGAVIGAAFATVALGQTPAQSGPAIDPAAALRTFGQVSEWLEAWETPTDAALPKGCVGVWVGLRLAGRPMGSGMGIDANKLDEPGTRALTGATRRAMSAAYETAGGVTDPDIRSDKQKKFVASPFRTLELDLAHSPKRIRATSLDRVLAQLRPGIDGLLMRRGDTSYALFPAEMLAFDTRPSSAIVSILSESGVSMDAVDLEIGNGTIRLWSFETVHLAQATREGPASFLSRGSRPVPLDSIDVAEVNRMADAMAEYLMRSTAALPDEPGFLLLLGDYVPYADRRLQSNATASEHALSALALLKYSGLKGKSPAVVDAARATATGLLRILARDEASRLGASQDARTAALARLAIRKLETDEITPEIAALADAARVGVERAFRSEQGFAAALSPEDRALVAAAQGTREAIDAAWLSVGMEMQPLLMPWICLAEIEAAEGGKSIPSLAALRNLRQRLQAAGGAGAGIVEEPDLVGALRYRANREPDWQAAHLVTFCAMMLGDARCTPEAERAREILNLQRAVRFVRQLQVREADRYRVRNPELALGGVRTGLCDQTMPVAASAAGLLATVTALEAFDALSGDGR